MVVFNVYLWTNGLTDPRATQRSNDLLDAVLTEWDALPPGPKMLCGDLNCDIADLPDVNRRIQEGMIVDLGAYALLFGHQANQPTCEAHNSFQATRRDYSLVSIEMFPMIKDVQVLNRGEVPIHSPIAIDLQIPDGIQKKMVLDQTVRGLATNIKQIVKQIHSISDHEDIPKSLLVATAELVRTHIDMHLRCAKEN